MLKAIRDPDLDHRLPGNAETLSLSIKRLDHPDREIYVDSFLLTTGASSLGKFQVLRDVFAGVKLLVELFSLHIAQPP
jgi:hypothetical protein